MYHNLINKGTQRRGNHGTRRALDETFCKCNQSLLTTALQGHFSPVTNKVSDSKRLRNGTELGYECGSGWHQGSQVASSQCLLLLLISVPPFFLLALSPQKGASIMFHGGSSCRLPLSTLTNPGVLVWQWPSSLHPVSFAPASTLHGAAPVTFKVQL